jgi:hypothetical protein
MQDRMATEADAFDGFQLRVGVNSGLVLSAPRSRTRDGSTEWDGA